MDPGLTEALDRGDPAAACSYVESEDDPARVLAMYHGALRHLYWSNKDIVTLVAVGRAALAFGADLEDPDLLGLLKSVAYDIGSFCWRGWDEPGIGLDASMQAFGAAAAALNLRLAERLDRPPIPRSAAHWLVGAHQLDTDREAAARSFEMSAQLAQTGGVRAQGLLARGYAAIARRTVFDTSELTTLEDGPELVVQLETARRVFG